MAKKVKLKKVRAQWDHWCWNDWRDLPTVEYGPRAWWRETLRVLKIR